MNKEKVILIIPAYNEQENILNVCSQIERFKQESRVNLDYIVINDRFNRQYRRSA